MSNTPIHTANWDSPERRKHERRRANALAYLDVGTGNGGIALDFSEDGMAFQAVGPIEGEMSMNLRIQLPDSRTRIRATAQIIWIREQTRQAGVRFLDLPAEARAQIQEWISTQDSLTAAAERVARHQELESQPPKLQEITREPRKDKWLSMIKLKEGESAQKTSDPATVVPEKPASEPAEREIPALPTPDRARSELGAYDTLPSAVLWKKEVAPQNPHYQKVTDPVTSGLFAEGDGQSSPALPSPAVARADDNGPTRPEVTVPPALPTVAEVPAAVEPSSPPRILAKLLHIDSRADLASVLPGTIPALRRKRKRNGAQKWAWIGGSVGLFSILCFGIGTWYLGNRSYPVQGSTAPTLTPPVALRASVEPEAGTVRPGSSGSTVKTARQPAPATAKTHRIEPPNTEAVPRKQTEAPALVAGSTPVTLVQRTLDQSKVQQDIPSTAAAQTLMPVTAATPIEVGSMQAPVPADSSAAPAPRIVAGRILRPADRFNESHLTYRVEPAYPPEAKAQRIEGAVKIHLFIGANGKVGNLQLVSGPPLLAPAAVEAAKLWQYLPALLNGKPVETEQDIEINFQLPR